MDELGTTIPENDKKSVIYFLLDFFKETKLINFVVNNKPLQKDSTNCGVYVCAWLAYFFKVLDKMPTSSTISNYRNVIYNDIAENSEVDY